ncbi:MAG: YfhO family protein [Blastocatellia bacterium]
MTDSLFRFWQSGKFKAEAAAILVIAVFFAVFFWPATWKGLLLVISDSLVYSYPMRVAAFDAIRHGSLPLWTPTIYSGYPLLSMAQLGLGYPLTWFYLVLPGYWAEQVYVLAPFLLTPIFTYAFLRQINCSRAAGLIAGLSFTYGGLMAGGLGHNGMFNNPVMWLPLMLLAIERARIGRFWLCLVGIAGAYSMCLLTGIGQPFLYSGLIAIGYAAFITFVVPPSGGEGRFHLKTLRPLLACLGGMTLAVGVAAFQILETMQAQRLSIRRELTYETFSQGGFTALGAFKTFLAPIHNLSWEASPYVASLAFVLAVIALIAAFASPSSHRRVFFWLGLALLSWLLMMGDNTPLSRWSFNIPIYNRFRLPWRHSFEWSLAIGILAAFGFDALKNWLARKSGETTIRWPELLAGLILVANLIAVGVGWWRASGLKLAAGEELLKRGQTIQLVTMSESAWWIWKLGFTVAALLAVVWCLRMAASAWRDALLATTVTTACFLEGFMLVSFWWYPNAKPASYYQSGSAAIQHLQQFPPEQNRIYTDASNYFPLNLSFVEMNDLTALKGFHNAAGYEPLMLQRYSKAFDEQGLYYLPYTPWLGAPIDRQLLSPSWRTLDLLNTRFIVEFSAARSEIYKKDGIVHAGELTGIDLPKGAVITLTGASQVDTLSLVSAMAFATDLPQGAPIAQFTFHTKDGRVVEQELKAGLHTAEWAHERPDVKAEAKHELPPVFESRPGDAQNSFPALSYAARIPLGEKLDVERIELKNLSDHASLLISRIALYDSETEKATSPAFRLPDHWRKIYDHQQTQIYENSRVRPRVWLNARAESVSGEEAFKRIRGQSETAFDPKEVALIEAPPSELSSLTADKLSPDAAARIVNYEANRLIIETKADHPAVLVTSEINYPGWLATVDGQPAAIYAADYLLRGIVLKAGTHRVEMRYTAPAARNGAVISALSLLLIVGVLVRAVRSHS